MPEYRAPGVFIEEVSLPEPIESAPADTAAFAGRAEAVGTAPPLDQLRSAEDFAARFATAALLSDGAPNLLWPAVQGYFANGGQRLQIVPMAPAADAAACRAAITALADTGAAIIAAPDIHAHSEPVAAVGALIDAATRSNAFAIVDPPPGLDPDAVAAWRQRFDSPDAALYWPWLIAETGGELPPSGHVAGVFARATIARGVAQSPANEPITGVSGAAVGVTREMQEALNPLSVNALRSFPRRGLLIWGARTLSRQSEYRYVAVRRLLRSLEQSIVAGLAWAVFEPNDANLWRSATALVEDFLIGYWRSGALMGQKPENAFFVRCDRSTMTQEDIDNGRLVMQIGVAPARPAEFLIFRIGQWTANRPDQ